jgi:ABC-type Fe3+ transport system permease subunit
VSGLVLPLLRPAMVSVWVMVALLAVRVAGIPLMFYSGSGSAVLSIALWQAYNYGQLGEACALGTMLVAFALLLAAVGRGITVMRSRRSGSTSLGLADLEPVEVTQRVARADGKRVPAVEV